MALYRVWKNSDGTDWTFREIKTANTPPEFSDGEEMEVYATFEAIDYDIAKSIYDQILKSYWCATLEIEIGNCDKPGG